MSEADVVELLRSACAAVGGAGAWAKQHQLSSSFVSDVLSHKRGLGLSIPQALNLRRIVCYQPAG